MNCNVIYEYTILTILYVSEFKKQISIHLFEKNLCLKCYYFQDVSITIEKNAI